MPVMWQLSGRVSSASGVLGAVFANVEPTSVGIAGYSNSKTASTSDPETSASAKAVGSEEAADALVAVGLEDKCDAASATIPSALAVDDARAIRARLRARAPPTLSALSARASRARTLAPPAPPPSAAEGVEPARIDPPAPTSLPEVGLGLELGDAADPRRARHRAARMSMAMGIAPPTGCGAVGPRTCPPRLRARIYPGFAHRHMHTSPARRAAPAHAISRLASTPASPVQVAVPRAPFLGATLPTALARVSRFIRSHTECTALASSTCPPRLRARIYPGFARRHMHTSPARRAAPAYAVYLARAQVHCIRSPALALTSASSTPAPPKWPFHTRRFSVQIRPPHSRACLGSSDRTPSVPPSPRDWSRPPHHAHRARPPGRSPRAVCLAHCARLAGVHVARATTASHTSLSPYTFAVHCSPSQAPRTHPSTVTHEPHHPWQLEARAGRKRYWRGLISDIFLGSTMRNGLEVLQKDIVNMWNMDDPEKKHIASLLLESITVGFQEGDICKKLDHSQELTVRDSTLQDNWKPSMVAVFVDIVGVLRAD
ncbi:hypothetical protein B0H14DRAFT_3906729 [Mycena olivaceomarginata]|nr:hypothetical protein B0H14DRAFT_3906729 [Mycena olivaceomarginata]